jgi:hypothetical protein
MLGRGWGWGHKLAVDFGFYHSPDGGVVQVPVAVAADYVVPGAKIWDCLEEIGHADVARVVGPASADETMFWRVVAADTWIFVVSPGGLCFGPFRLFQGTG